MKIAQKLVYLFVILIFLLSNISTQAQNSQGELIISSNWKLQDSAIVKANGNEISRSRYLTKNWFTATVPGTVTATDKTKN